MLIDLAGDEATIRANVLSVWVRAGASPEFGLGGVYRFAARRTAGGWRLCRIEITPVWRTAA